MAASDYKLCDMCGRKAFYDAHVDYDVPSLGQVMALCAACEESHYIAILPKTILPKRPGPASPPSPRCARCGHPATDHVGKGGSISACVAEGCDCSRYVSRDVA